jgi:hypothetical protein
MTFAPPTIVQAAKVWTSNGGKNLGIVGNAAHRARQSYHNGKDAIDEFHRTAANDYSIRLKADRDGLTNAASALDLGRLNGSLDELRAFSKWLVEYTQDAGPGTEDIREIIFAGTHKGKIVVLRWLRDRGVASAPQPGEADDSHLTHSHISWLRSSEFSDKTGPFRTYFEEEQVRGFVRLAGPAASIVVKDAGAGGLLLRGQGKVVPVPVGLAYAHGDPIKLLDPIIAGKPRTDFWMLGRLIGFGASQEAMFVLERNCTVTPIVADCSAPIAAAVKVAVDKTKASARIKDPTIVFGA